MFRSKLINARFALIAAIGAAVIAASGGSAASASASQAWLHLNSGSVPTVLQEGRATDEVQDLKVAATGGEVTVLEPKSYEEFEKTFNFGVLKYGCFKYDATPEEAQEAIEQAYGAGTVQVSGGPGDEQGSKPYEVTFTGSLADQPVKPMETLGVCAFFGHEGLAGQVTVSEELKGRPDGDLVVTAENLGDSDLSGEASPVSIVDTLPPGLTAISAEGVAGPRGTTLERAPVKCAVESSHAVDCTFEGALPPYETIEVQIGAVTNGAKSGEDNKVAVSGGNTAKSEPVERPIAVGGETPFGVESYEMAGEEEGGAADTQAGSHPFQLTTTVMLNNNYELSKPPAMVKDLNFHLPPGLLGNPTPFPQCTEAQFTKEFEFVNECPNDTAVGAASVDILNGTIGHLTAAVPLFNLVPSAGEPARFGFLAYGVPVYLDTAVRTGSDYGVTVKVDKISQDATLLASHVTFWGVPGDPSHDDARGWSCIDEEGWQKVASGLIPPCTPLAEHSPPPLLSMPTSCTGLLQSTVESDSWLEPGSFQTFGLVAPMTALDGCNRLPFSPTISVAPDLSDASSPSGLTVGIHVPQELVTNGTALAESTVKDTTVTLPQGVTINPGGGDGLEACSEAEIGYTGHEAPYEIAAETFSATLPQPFCPQASKIGTVEITTPLLPNPLTGAVYLATPAPNGEAGMNPFKTLLALYIVAEDPVSGTLIKLPGTVTPNPVTGQLVSSFEDTPQLPFEDLTLHFFGGERAPLATPALCGAYTTTASIAPWSGSTPSSPSSSFQIASGPNGAPCADPRPFQPEFQAGSTNIQAGEYSEFLTTMGHPDADQVLGGLTVKLPEGLMGSLASVKLCEEPQAAEGTCGSESLIGHTVVTAGLGSTPAVVKRQGSVYITGPYRGAPYGLSIVNPAEVGPFDLGDVVVRAKIEVNLHTAQLTIASDPLPTILKGIPLDLQHVQVAISRPHFTFNPTNCSKTAIEGSISSNEGASVPISTPFQVTNCAALPFKPGFTATTKAKHTRKDGAYLQVKVTSGSGQADIAKAKVELPRALPSELKTLQKACTEAQFDANPAGCPVESDVGSVVVHTPVLPVPLTGPAYFVSRGAQWPELIMVLQGYGVTIELNGETHISKGVTSTTLSTVPDVPFTSFTLTLPQSPHSALAGNGKLCKKQLIMPVKFTGQNGALVAQKTKVKVTGCATSRKKHRNGRRKGKGARHKQRHPSRRQAAQGKALRK